MLDGLQTLMDENIHLGHMELVAPVTTSCAVIGTYYKITDVAAWGDPLSVSRHFTIDPAGKLTYTSPNDTTIVFHGSSDVEVDKASTITYALYMNGVLVPAAQTPHKFSNALSVSNIAIVNSIKISQNDYFEIFVKSDTITTDVTSTTLSLVLNGMSF